MTGLPPGKCEVRAVVVPAYHARTAISTSAPQDRLTVQLGPGGVIHVRLEPAAVLAGFPCTICLDRRAEDSVWTRYRDPLAPFELYPPSYYNAEATLTNLPPGTYRVCLRACATSGASVSAPFSIRVGQPYEVLLELKRGRSIRGRVGPGGASGFACVRFAHDSVDTDENGRFRIDHVPLEEFLLMVGDKYMSVPSGQRFIDLRLDDLTPRHEETTPPRRLDDER